MKKESSNRKIVFLFGIFFVFLFIQHQFVYMYFDDYGYASLSYGYTENHAGMNYSILDFVKFIWWHYFEWGGRVLYYSLGILSMKAGLWCVRLVQTVFILGITIFSYFLIRSKEEQKNDWFKAFIIVVLYACIGLTTFNEGIFWFSASMGYVWALCPLLAAVYCQQRFHEEGVKKYFWISGTLFFVAGFSYEQIAFLTAVYVLLYYGIEWCRNKVYMKGSLGIVTAALLGSGIEILAPGNFIRADGDMNAAFYELSFFEKVLKNIPQVLYINLGSENRITVVFFLLSGIMVSYLLFQRCKKAKLIYKINMIASIILSAAVPATWWMEKEAWFVCVLLILWIVWYCVNITVFLVEKYSFLVALFYGGICSLGMMLISPTVPMRCHIPFEFVMHIIVALVIVEFLQEKGKVIQTATLGIMICAALYNMVPITLGYYRNAEIHNINHNKLIEKSARIKAGMDVNTIILYRLEDDRFASQMPYQQSFIEYWVRNYYEIPQNVHFIWDDLETVSTSNEAVVTDVPKIMSLYPSRIDNSVTYNDDGSLNIGVTPEVISDNLRIRINGVEFETIIDSGFISTKVPVEMLQDNLEITIYDNASGNSSDSMIMEIVK